MDIDKLCNVLSNNELAIVPTDTVYGILASAINEDAIRKVYQVKKRDFSKPCIILVSSISMLKEYVLSINDLEEKLIKRFWPGKLTIIFKKNKNVSDLLTANKDTVGIRYPLNKDLIECMNKFGFPLVSSSANLSNEGVITDISLISSEMLENISYVYDGGHMSDSSSTIVQVVDNRIKILRDGELSPVIRSEFKEYL